MIEEPIEEIQFLDQEIIQKPTGLEKPEPPLIGEITHFSIAISWKHVKDKLPYGQRFKFCLQEQSHKTKGEWIVIYTYYF